MVFADYDKNDAENVEMEIGKLKLEAGNWEMEPANWKMEPGSREMEAGRRKTDLGMRKVVAHIYIYTRIQHALRARFILASSQVRN